MHLSYFVFIFSTAITLGMKKWQYLWPRISMKVLAGMLYKDINAQFSNKLHVFQFQSQQVFRCIHGITPTVSVFILCVKLYISLCKILKIIDYNLGTIQWHCTYFDFFNNFMHLIRYGMKKFFPFHDSHIICWVPYCPLESIVISSHVVIFQDISFVCVVVFWTYRKWDKLSFCVWRRFYSDNRCCVIFQESEWQSKFLYDRDTFVYPIMITF